MRPTTASLALAALLGLSLAGKSVGLTQSGLADPNSESDIVAFLEERGFAVLPPDRETAPVWIVGVLGACRIRVADVAPEGWARAIIAEQTAGERLAYVFAGRFLAEQPVISTRMENYHRRLIRYLGFEAPALRLRAVAVSPACPPDIMRSQDAERLSS
ncbi:hypothetical protein KEU06_12400 [Pseudaminobacter sp. 19-2017]|uniref:Uncharacterized protein n=1 Tax=Pseudaminobacter soli (ex Zhang et al. 2022) TaxID=2831468 RepID=A0A942DX82_9HYPH|nr:hypothetical protein [Pseudaminobacter soli]MBS3649409.1 hypothetical protein [Pseudaminobacter soli]